MTMISISVDSDEIFSEISQSDIFRYFGEELLDFYTIEQLVEAAGGMSELINDLPDEVIDHEFASRHPNQSELLDRIDDELIIDYLINKGYDIEM